MNLARESDSDERDLLDGEEDGLTTIRATTVLLVKVMKTCEVLYVSLR